MEFVLVSSLEGRALTVISATMLNNRTNRGLFSEVVSMADDTCGWLSPNKDADWLSVHMNVEAKVQKLSIPALLKKKITSYVNPASYEILNWLQFHVCRCKLMKKVPEKFQWTPHGNIDLQKTASMLVCDSTIDVENRFKLACMYCLEDHIFTLWDQLDEDSRECMDYSHVNMEMFILVNYWCHYIRAKRDASIEDRDLYMCPVAGLYRSLEADNVVAVKFFLAKLTDKQRKKCLVDFITTMISGDFPIVSIDDVSCNHKYTEILCLVLNHLDAEQQITVLKGFPAIALILFLKWPWQDYFIKVHQYVGQLLQSDQFFYVLDQIISKQNARCKDYDYEKIVNHFWLHSSDKLRKDIHNFCNPLSEWLPNLYKLGNWRTFNFIAQDANKEQREELLSSLQLSKMFSELIAENNWDAIEFFITKCLLSDEEITAFKVRMNQFHNKPAIGERFSTFNNLFDDVNVAKKKNCVSNGSS